MRSIKLGTILIAFSTLFITASVDGSVLTVGNGCDFNNVQAAVNAASDGDIILLCYGAGSNDPVTIVNKSLSIVSENSAAKIRTGHITVKNLASDKTVTLSRIRYYVSFWPPTDVGIKLEYNAGSVRCEDCIFDSSYAFYSEGFDAAILRDCKDVAFIRCSLVGGDAITYNAPRAGHGIDSLNSHVSLYDCIVQGGFGEENSLYLGGDGPDGGDGFHGYNSFLFASGCQLIGEDAADGGDGDDHFYPGDGGDGGDGIDLKGASEAWLRDNSISCGEAGEGGICYHGPFPDGLPGQPGKLINADPALVHFLTGTAHQLQITSPVREGGNMMITFQGNPGDHCLLLLAADTGNAFFKGLEGVCLLSLSPFPIVLNLGILDSTGTLYVPVTVPELGPSVEGIKIHTQSFFMNSFGMEETLGTAQSVFLLDSGI